MDWKEFDEQIKAVRLYASSISDTNRRPDVRQSGSIYAEVPLDGNFQFLEGIIVPSQEELVAEAEWEVGLQSQGLKKKLFRAHRLEAHLGISEYSRDDLADDEKYKEIIRSRLSDIYDQHDDIRFKARQLGADALVDVRPGRGFAGYRSFIGTPVKKGML